MNGIKYYLTLELSPTNCSRPLETEDPACLADPEAQPLLYSVEILEPPQQELDTQLLELSEVRPGDRRPARRATGRAENGSGWCGRC